MRTALALGTVCFLAATFGFPAAADGDTPGSLHAPYHRLLGEYVSGFSVDYAAWHENDADRTALDDYVAALEGADPESMEPNHALAYWINLYNAITVKLILDNYPVDSIKDLGGLLSSPWGKELVTVDGEDLTLDHVEHDIIRERFADARIHFALNCASVSCPPLAPEAYRGDRLDAQLDAACARALSHDRWLRIGAVIRVSKIFDWYGDDFARDAGSVRAFIARYRPDTAETILDPEYEIEFMDYDWNLNDGPG